MSRGARLLGVAALALAAACGKADTLVVVSVTAEPMLASVSSLHVHAATDDGAQMDYDFQPAAPVPLPPAQSFALEVASRYTGTFTVTVTARDGATDLASASTSTPLAGGGRIDLPIRLGTGAPTDGGVDGGADLLPAVRPSFAAPAPVAGAPELTTAISLDFNGDTLTDVIGTVGSTGTSTVEVLLSKGDGTFTPGPTINGHVTATSRADGVAAVDLDGEGSPDVVISNGEGGDVTVVFGPDYASRVMSYASSSTGLGCAVLGVRLADLTGDGNLDIVAHTNCLHGLELWSGLGDGRFNPVVDRTFVPGGTAVIQDFLLRDLNHDGLLDVVATEAGATGTVGQLDVALGAGGGMLGDAVALPTATEYPSSLHLADLDADGYPDLIYSEGNSNQIASLRGNGDGTFRGAVELGLPSSTAGPLAIADFDGDGKLDLAGSLPNSGNVLFVARGNGDGTFATPATWDVGTTVLGQLLAFDVNRDGKPDLISTWPLVVLVNTTAP